MQNCESLDTGCVLTEDVEPVDKDTVAKVAALEKKLKEKEAAVKALREQVCKPFRIPICALSFRLIDARLLNVDSSCVVLLAQVPKLAAEKTRSQLEKSRKRSADVELTYVPALNVMHINGRPG